MYERVSCRPTAAISAIIDRVSRLRLLALSNTYPPTARGGYGEICGDVMEGLAQRGHDRRRTQRTGATGRWRPRASSYSGRRSQGAHARAGAVAAADPGPRRCATGPGGSALGAGCGARLAHAGPREDIAAAPPRRPRPDLLHAASTGGFSTSAPARSSSRPIASTASASLLSARSSRAPWQAGSSSAPLVSRGTESRASSASGCAASTRASAGCPLGARSSPLGWSWIASGPRPPVQPPIAPGVCSTRDGFIRPRVSTC